MPIEKFADRSFLTNYFSGTGYAFRREAVQRAGLFPEILYMHYEELELAYRILDQASLILYVPHISVIHHEHQISRRSEIQEFYKNRNQVLVAVQCMPVLKAVSYLTPRIAYALIGAIKGRRIGSFYKMIQSAVELGKVRIQTRSPLKPETWRLMRSMKKGLTR